MLTIIRNWLDGEHGTNVLEWPEQHLAGVVDWLKNGYKGTQRYYNLRKVSRKGVDLEKKTESNEGTVVTMLSIVQEELNGEHGADVSRWSFLQLQAFVDHINVAYDVILAFYNQKKDSEEVDGEEKEVEIEGEERKKKIGAE